LFDENYNKLRETKYYYDNKLVGLTRGDLTKQEEWLDDETGNPTTTFTYDDFGNLYQETDALGRTTTRDYGIRDFTNTYADRITNELGHAIDYNYDVATGNIIDYTKHGVKFLYEYDTFGRVINDIDPYDNSNLPTKEYTYDFDGVAPEVIKVSSKTTSNKTLDTYYYYDGQANLVQIKTPSEDGQQVVKNIFYDGLGRVKEEQNPYFSDFSTDLTNVSNVTNTTKYTYDALSRITQVTNPDGTIKQTNYSKSVIKDFDENNNHKTYYLDAYDRIIAVEEHNTDFYLGDNESYNTSYNYDAADQLIGIRDHLGNEFNFTYNSLGQKIQLDDPDLGKWKYAYDFAGNLVNQTDNKENSILMGYDKLNRIKNKTTSASTNYSFFYDVQYQGTLSRINFSNITYEYTYDDRLRPIKEIRRIKGLTLEKEFTYDSMDRMLQILLPNGNDIDYYYGAQGRLDEIRGWINNTKYNAFGNPLNRSFNIPKATEFTYYFDNARLKQIKTDTVQDLNYSYDNVGNILEIDDDANNRLYSMSYDALDRLTNVSIDKYKWVYSFDAIGNILKIVRNFSTTTSFKMDGSLAHAPQKVLVADTGADVYKPEIINYTNRTKQVKFYLVNEKNESVSNVNWSVTFGDGNRVSADTNFTLNKGQNILVTANSTYNFGGEYKINISSNADSSLNDYETIKLIFGTLAKSLGIIKKNATLLVTDFNAKNSLSQLSTDWDWECNNGVKSTVPFNMSANEELLVVMEHNYSLSNSSLNCIINSTDGNQSITAPLSYDGIEITNYNSTKVDIDTVNVQFIVTNYFSQQNLSWTIDADGTTYSSNEEVTLNQGQSTSISQDINFTNAGTKKILITASSDNFTDTYSENVRLYSLGVQDFLNIIKNGTTRIFNFFIRNDWINLTAKWNISNPQVENTVNLSNNESLIVVIEENYGQGKKQPKVQVFNQSYLEDIELDVFIIKQIGINEFEVLYEEDKKAITQALITNNIAPLNISWQLDDGQDTINSLNNTQLGTSESAFVIIESNYDNSGIYPLNFIINSSDKNDNQTGVAVS
jgi:YD repeat-containing protein